MDQLKYLELRQLGFSGLKKYVNGLFIDKMVCILPEYDNNNIHLPIQKYCKFSRNKTNLHIVGCSDVCGKIIIFNTSNHSDPLKEIVPSMKIHTFKIDDFAWAEPQMKLVTASYSSSILMDLNPSGKLVKERLFEHDDMSEVNSVQFCPGSSSIFCSGSRNGSIKIWDARRNINSSIFDTGSDNKRFGISTVIFKNDQTVISSSSCDSDIIVWDLRYTQNRYTSCTGFRKMQLMKYAHPLTCPHEKIYCGFTHIIINPQSTHLYGCCIHDDIYRFALDSTKIINEPICQYSSTDHYLGNKISISNDGKYLFSGGKAKQYKDNIGAIWSTNFPHIEKPVYQIMGNSSIRLNSMPYHSFQASDWCADSTCMKLVVGSEFKPLIFYVPTGEEKYSKQTLKISRTNEYKPKLYSTNLHTIPIKFDD